MVSAIYADRTVGSYSRTVKVNRMLEAAISELNQIRLDEDLSYGALAAQIGVDRAVLFRALSGERKPIDRTLHKMRRYLDRRRSRKQRPER